MSDNSFVQITLDHHKKEVKWSGSMAEHLSSEQKVSASSLVQRTFTTGHCLRRGTSVVYV